MRRALRDNRSSSTGTRSCRGVYRWGVIPRVASSANRRRVAALLGLSSLALAACAPDPPARPPAPIAEAGPYELLLEGISVGDRIVNQHGVTVGARPHEQFLQVRVVFRSASGQEPPPVATTRAVLRYPDGHTARADGGGDEGLCVDCRLELETEEKRFPFTFLFVLERPAPEGDYAFSYGGSDEMPIALPASATKGDRDGAELAGAEWRKVEPGGRTKCARGGRYAFWVRPASADKLLVFFQAGGGCFDFDSCAPGSSLMDDSVRESEDSPAPVESGVLDFSDPDNPFHDYSAVYIPSCTGDVHWGDNRAVYRSGARRVAIEHRGFVNASAALDWVYRHVASPRAIFVAGCSAGSVGSAAHAPYIIRHYRNARIAQLGDSFAFVFHRPVDIQEDYGALDNLPAWIPALRRIAPGGFTMARYYAALASYYPRAVFAQFNYAGDPVQRMFFEAVGGEASDFRSALERSLERIHRAAPSNFRSYTAAGAGHCIINTRGFHGHETDGVALRDWVERLANGAEIESVGRR